MLPIERHQPDLLLGLEIEVNNSQTAPSAFASTRVGPAHFAKSAGTRHHIAGARIGQELLLKRPVAFIIEILVDVASEGRRFNEFHRCQYTSMAYNLNPTPKA